MSVSEIIPDRREHTAGEKCKRKALVLSTKSSTTVRPFAEFAGTPEYYPPEWFAKKQYDGDSMTVWSVGILLYSIALLQFA